MIRRTWALILFMAICAAAVSAQQATTATQQPAPPSTHLKVGQQAPDFTLMDTAGKEVKLSDYKSKKNVVLAFYVLAFTGG
jgi:cytochrome oxidase Cu insertion factor (SCO1/SenC/PrrC family)